MSAIKLDPRVRIFTDEWIDVTERTRVDSGIEIFHGQQDESKEPDSSWCQLTFDNRTGDFTPRNPMGAFAGYLNKNTPICVLLDEVTDTYTRPADNDSWNATDTGETWQTLSVGAPILATDYSTNGTQGIHSVPTTNAYRMSYFDGTTTAPYVRNVIQRVQYTPSFTDVTGANIEPANLLARVGGPGSYYMCRVNVLTDESVTITIMRDSTSTVLAGPVTVPGVTHQSGQGIWILFGTIDDDIMATAWVGTEDDQPTDWLIHVTEPVIDVFHKFGWYGIRSGVATGNTNAKPIIFTYDNYKVWVAEFCGDIPDFPQKFTEDYVSVGGQTVQGDATVPITAAGITRRLDEGGTELVSTARRHYENGIGNSPDYYWPLDDGELATVGRATVRPAGYGPEDVPFQFDYATSIDPDSANQKHFGQHKLAAWLPNGVSLLPDNAAFYVGFPEGSAPITSPWAWDWGWTLGSNVQTNVLLAGWFPSGITILGSPFDMFGISVDTVSGDLVISPGLAEATTTLTISTLPVNILDGRTHWYRFRVNSAATDIHWTLHIDGIEVANEVEISHQMIDRMYTFQVYNTNTTTGAQSVGVSHIAGFFTTDPLGDEEITYNALVGRQGETAKYRFGRLCDESDVEHYITLIPDPGGAEMGPQYSDSLMDQLFEVLRTDGGLLVEIPSGRGLNYYTLDEIREFPTGLTIDVSARQMAPDFEPVDNTQKLLNSIRVGKRDGGDYSYAKTTGRLGTADPKSGGAGIYGNKRITVNPYQEGQLVTIAQREVSEGTVDKARFPDITVDLISPEVSSDVSLRRSILDTEVGSRIALTNLPYPYSHEDLGLMAIGRTRFMTNHVHRITYNTMPYDSFDVFRVETPTSITTTNSSFIVDSIDESDTTFRISTLGMSLWTTDLAYLPITARLVIPPANVSGEDISITSITTTAPGYRSVGTASHADNANTSPGLPAGQQAGDTLLLVTAIRNTAATANVPAGYGFVNNSLHFRVCVKTSTGGSEVAPTCTYSGGAAGDTTSSVIVALTNSPFGYTSDSLATVETTNTSAQNIAYETNTLLYSNGIELLIAWKQDDYTSVDVPTGFTEIGEFSTTTGNDQSLYLAYRLVPTRDDSPSGTLVVTGGASAVSKSIKVGFANPQDVVATRGVNGVERSWTSDTSIVVSNPKVLG